MCTRTHAHTLSMQNIPILLRLPVTYIHTHICHYDTISNGRFITFWPNFLSITTHWEVMCFQICHIPVSLHPPRILATIGLIYLNRTTIITVSYVYFPLLHGIDTQSRGMSQSPPVGSNLLQPFTRHRLRLRPPPPWDAQSPSVGTEMERTSVTWTRMYLSHTLCYIFSWYQVKCCNKLKIESTDSR